MGKQRDLNECSIEELEAMWERNDKLLSSSPSITSSLPRGGEKIQERQEMIRDKLEELGIGRVGDGIEGIKLEESIKVDHDREGGWENPRTKVRILRRTEVSSTFQTGRGDGKTDGDGGVVGWNSKFIDCDYIIRRIYSFTTESC